MGKKYIIELEDKPLKNYGNNAIDLYRVKGFKSLVFDSTGLSKLEEYKEPNGTGDAEEAWQFAAKVFTDGPGCMAAVDVRDCFGTKGLNYIGQLPYNKARNMYNKWVNKKNEEEKDYQNLKVGDILVSKSDGSKFVILYVDNGYYGAAVIGEYSEYIRVIDKQNCRKNYSVVRSDIYGKEVHH